MRDIRALMQELEQASNLNPVCASTTYSGVNGQQCPQYEIDRDAAEPELRHDHFMVKVPEVLGKHRRNFLPIFRTTTDVLDEEALMRTTANAQNVNRPDARMSLFRKSIISHCFSKEILHLNPNSSNPVH